MTQLHLIQSPIDFQDFEQRYEQCVNNEDSILFLNDSLFSLTTKAFNSSSFHKLAADNSIYCIHEQIQARSISDLVSKTITAIDYKKFVYMSQKAQKVVSW
ncbi:MAG: sulfurtransferase complex subunit TusB [Kangiellaceae bacterium]|nr:sulfurtransferase complex subunit TusB [Kangiellaceae bacterium]